MLRRLMPLLLVVLVCVLTASADYPVDARVDAVREHAAYARAVDALGTGFPAFVDDIVTLTEIPAPPFAEQARAEAFMAMLRDAGLTDVERDREGNVTAVRRGGGEPFIAVSAHLDTVFPAGTNVTVTRAGTRLMAPGIGDDTQGLAVLLALVRAMHDGGIETTSDLLFVGTVGEEGAGSLRGVRHLFETGRYRNRIGTFITVDGAGPGNLIVNRAVGSERYRVTFSGPGGHSYNGFGLVNPAYALASAVRRIAMLDADGEAKTTFNVGRIGGGTSVNSIPSDAWLEVDLRSESPEQLSTLVDAFDAAMHRAANEENGTRSTGSGRIRVAVEHLGGRPAGSTPLQSPLVETAAAVTRAMGGRPEFVSSSTDANLPMSLGIPAIAIGSGLAGGRAHSPDEWIDVARDASLAGLERVLLLVTSVAGLD